jgi:hypothetical protein
MINNYIESVDFNFVSDGRPFEKFDIGANIHFYEEEIFDFFHSGSGSFVFAAIAAILMGHAYMYLIDRQLEESERS